MPFRRFSPVGAPIEDNDFSLVSLSREEQIGLQHATQSRIMRLDMLLSPISALAGWSVFTITTGCRDFLFSDLPGT